MKKLIISLSTSFQQLFNDNSMSVIGQILIKIDLIQKLHKNYIKITKIYLAELAEYLEALTCINNMIHVTSSADPDSWTARADSPYLFAAVCRAHILLVCALRITDPATISILTCMFWRHQ